MTLLSARGGVRLLLLSVVAAGVSTAACGLDSPAAPSETTFPTVVITADGIARDVPFLIPGSPVRIVNESVRRHRIHLDVGPPQPGCEPFDTVGELAPGESRMTAPIGPEADRLLDT